MKRWVRGAVTLFVAGAFVVGMTSGASAAPAGGAVAAPTPEAAGRYCVLVLDKAIDPKTGVSRVADQACSTESLAAAADKIPSLRADLAKAGIRAGDSNRYLAQPNATTELARVYETVNYGSGKVSVYGTSGTCNTSGYNFNSIDLVGSYASAVGLGKCSFMETYLRGRVGGNEYYNYSLPSADCRSRCQSYTTVRFHA